MSRFSIQKRKRCQDNTHYSWMALRWFQAYPILRFVFFLSNAPWNVLVKYISEKKINCLSLFRFKWYLGTMWGPSVFSSSLNTRPSSYFQFDWKKQNAEKIQDLQNTQTRIAVLRRTVQYGFISYRKNTGKLSTRLISSRKYQTLFPVRF